MPDDKPTLEDLHKGANAFLLMTLAFILFWIFVAVIIGDTWWAQLILALSVVSAIIRSFRELQKEADRYKE